MLSGFITLFFSNKNGGLRSIWMEIRDQAASRHDVLRPAISAVVPEYTQRIRDIQCRRWDLLPVVRNHVYHPAFRCSFSLKAVLPALVPELTYEGMEVPNGQVAGLAGQAIIGGNCSEAERQAKRKALLDYCGQDTLALVRLLERLSSLPPRA